MSKFSSAASEPYIWEVQNSKYRSTQNHKYNVYWNRTTQLHTCTCKMFDPANCENKTTCSQYNISLNQGYKCNRCANNKFQLFSFAVF